MKINSTQIIIGLLAVIAGLLVVVAMRPGVTPEYAEAVKEPLDDVIPADVRDKIEDNDAQSLKLFKRSLAKADSDIASITSDLKEETNGDLIQVLQERLAIAQRERANAEHGIQLIEKHQVERAN